MAAALAESYSRPASVVPEYRLGNVRHITASSRRLREELGWKPRIPFAEGMTDCPASRVSSVLSS
jgi:dTDP-L-rhamnose 4-epimerase